MWYSHGTKSTFRDSEQCRRDASKIKVRSMRAHFTMRYTCLVCSVDDIVEKIECINAEKQAKKKETTVPIRRKRIPHVF